MTREEWVKVRVEPHIPLGVWFSYYREMGGDIEDPIEFEEVFLRIMREQPLYIDVAYGKLIHINEDSARNRLYSYYDSMFSTYET